MVTHLPDGTDTALPVLHLDTGTGTWFAGIGDELWRLDGRHAPLLLAGFCRIETAEPVDPAFRARCAGDARVIPEPDGAACVLECRPAAPGTARRLRIPASALQHPRATWREGMYPDGWIVQHAVLDVERVTRLGLRVFLPRNDALSGKTLTIAHEGTPLAEVPLARGRQREIWIDLDPLTMALARLDFTLDMAEPARGPGDKRALGCVVRSMNLAGDWIEAQQPR